jgi:hypothetical protein
MVIFEAHCRSGHFLAAVVPKADVKNRMEYQILVFQQGNEVYEENEETLEGAIRTAKAYLDWRRGKTMTVSFTNQRRGE